MHLAITPILIYIVNPPPPFDERNLFLIFHPRYSVQVRLLFSFLYLYYRALSFLLIRSSLSVYKIFTTFNVPRVK